MRKTETVKKKKRVKHHEMRTRIFKLLYIFKFKSLSLVCLVAVPHFDSPFDETDHVFILIKEELRVKQTNE